MHRRRLRRCCGLAIAAIGLLVCTYGLWLAGAAVLAEQGRYQTDQRVLDALRYSQGEPGERFAQWRALESADSYRPYQIAFHQHLKRSEYKLAREALMRGLVRLSGPEQLALVNEALAWLARAARDPGHNRYPRQVLPHVEVQWLLACRKELGAEYHGQSWRARLLALQQRGLGEGPLACDPLSHSFVGRGEP